MENQVNEHELEQKDRDALLDDPTWECQCLSHCPAHSVAIPMACKHCGDKYTTIPISLFVDGNANHVAYLELSQYIQTRTIELFCYKCEKMTVYRKGVVQDDI